MLRRMLGRAHIGLAATGLAILGVARYRRDLRRDRERVAKFEPSVIDTPFGRVEYAQAGDGPPVMVVHGVLGGFDFGVGVGRVNVPGRLSDHLAVAVRVLRVAAAAGSFARRAG